MNNIRLNPNLSLSFPSSSKPDSFIESCQKTEKALEAKSKNNISDAFAYIEFLNDLNRFDEGYKAAIQLISFFPDLEGDIGNFAILLEDEAIILKYLKTLSPEPNALQGDWIKLIMYHFRKGTIDELAYDEKRLPENKSTKSLIYFFSGDYHKVYALLKEQDNLRTLDIWLLFIACQKLNKVRDRERYFAQIEFKNCIPGHIILKDSLDALERSITPSNRNRVQIFLQKQLEGHPYCIELLRLLSRITEAPLSLQYNDRAISLRSNYVNVQNEAGMILDSFSSELEVFVRLFEFFKRHPVQSVFLELLERSESNPKQRSEVITVARSLKQSFFFEMHFALNQSPTDERGRKETLEKVANLLMVSPHHKKLLLKKITLLIELNRFEYALNEIDQFIKYFGHNSGLLNLLRQYAEKLNAIDTLIDCEFEEVKVNPSESNFETLIKRYRKHKSPIECVRSTIDAALIFNLDVVADDFYQTLNELEDKRAAIAILERVPLKPCFFVLLTNRALHCANADETDKALVDIEAVIKYKNVDKSKEIKLWILIKGKKFEEAAAFYTSSSFECPVELLQDLICDLMDDKKYDWIEKVLKKTKRKLTYKEKSLLSFASISLEKHRDAIPLLRELILENPQDDNNYFKKALCYEALGQLGNAIDTLSDAITIFPDHLDWVKWRSELQEQLNAPTAPVLKSQPANVQAKVKQNPVDPKKVTHIIQESPKKAGRKQIESDGPKPEKIKKVLQNAHAHAVDPLADPLADIKALAKKGESQTGPKEKPIPAPLPIAAPVKSEPPKPIVKLTLRPREKVFLKKAHTALSDYIAMKAPLLNQGIVFRNQIYTILRVFTPLRLNAKHPQLINDLKRIRDNARHDTDQLSQERLDALFNYLKTINLEHQLQDWIREKSIITKLMLQNHILTVRKQKRTAQEKVIQELEFIIKESGDKATWNDRLYHRNAIKASLSIIGEASNFLADEHKKLFAEYREAGNEPAHEFFTDGETLESVERLKEEDISPDELWNLIQNAENLLKEVKNP